MTQQGWAKVKAVFQEAVDRPAADRAAFLDVATGDDVALRREVESLLVSDAAEFSLLDRVAIARFDATALAEDLGGVARGAPRTWPVVEDTGYEEEPGTVFGPYRLLQTLGVGGMGAVWLAQQEHPIHRCVAVKVVRRGLDSRHVLSRFESERQALAILNHQHIAKVFDAGMTGDGRPYFVMEHVEGVSITAYSDQHALTVRQRLELFLQVCDAVQHAHQRGVLHRDLKPSNLLVAGQEGSAVVKVIDFGISKAIGQQPTGGDEPQTGFGIRVGTPGYMSPEQAGFVDAPVDTRSDIYALGLVLYELLVGSPAIARRQVQSIGMFHSTSPAAEPPRLTARLRAQDRDTADRFARLRRTEPRALLRQLRGDLEWITARALHERPDGRYASVSELGADILRHLGGLPVLAGPPSTRYRVRKFVGRHRVGAIAFGLVALAVTLSAIVTSIALVRAVQAEGQSRRQLTASLVTQGMQKVESADSLSGLVYLVRALELETDPSRIRSHRIRIGETLQRAPRLVGLWVHGSHMLALSSTGVVATSSPSFTIEFRDISTGRLRYAGLQQGGFIIDGEFSVDGALLAVGSEDGHVRVWDPAGGRLVRSFELPSVVDVAITPDGRWVAGIGEDGLVNVWDVRRGALHFSGRHEGGGRRAVFSNDGTVLATAGLDGVRTWRMSGPPVGPLLRHDGPGGVIHLAFSTDDAWLVSAGRDATARLWDVRTWRQVGQPMRHDAAVTGVTFGPASDLLVTTSIDRTTRVWRIPDTTAIGPPRRSATVVQQPAAISRGGLIASPTQGGSVDLWSIDGERAAPGLPHGGQATVQFDRTGRFLVTAADDGLGRVWDLAPALSVVPKIVSDEAEFAGHVVLSPNGRSLAVSSAAWPDRGAVRVFELETGAPITPAMRFAATNVPIAFSPDGGRLLTASSAGDVRVWDVRTGEPLTPLIRETVPISCTAFSPRGTSFVVAGGVNGGPVGARIRRASDGTALTGFLSHDEGREPVRVASFSPDGERLLTAATGPRRTIRVWNALTGRLVWAADHGGVPTATWSADGRTVFTGASDSWVRAWDGLSGASRSPAIKMIGSMSSLGVTRDGTRLLSGTSAGDVRLIDLAHGSQMVSTMRHHGYVYQTLFSRDGSLALTSASERTVQLWDARTGEPLTPNLPVEPVGRSATFVTDAGAVAWGGTGVFVDELAIEERSTGELRRLAETAAGQTISASGVERALAADEIQARFATTNDSRAADATWLVDYERARARSAWRHGNFEELIDVLVPLSRRGAMNWSDFMRLAGAYAATHRWQEALGEIRQRRNRWQAAPELLYMEAVALARSGQAAGVWQLCRAGLEITGHSRHPERAYWVSRACLVSGRLAPDQAFALEERITHAYPPIAGLLGPAELRGALLLRTGRPREAFDQLTSAGVPRAAGKVALLLVAVAAARSGSRAKASKWLTGADAIRESTIYRHLRPWLDAEAESLREELAAALNQRATQSDAPTQSSSRSTRLATSDR